MSARHLLIGDDGPDFISEVDQAAGGMADRI